MLVSWLIRVVSLLFADRLLCEHYQSLVQALNSYQLTLVIYTHIAITNVTC